MAEQERWRAIKAIDRICALIEVARLDGIILDAQEYAAIRGLLGTKMPRPIPPELCRAKTTAALHATLLDWQETLLDDTLPERRRLPDVAAADGNVSTQTRQVKVVLAPLQ